MNRVLKFNEFKDTGVNEGWLHNLAMIGSLIFANIPQVKGQDIDTGFSDKKSQIEQMEQKNLSYAAMVGYLLNMPTKTIEEKGAIKEARIYFEKLRDGEKPSELSPLAKKVVDFATEEAKKLSGKELYELSLSGVGVLTKKIK